MTTSARRARLLAALGFLEIRWRGYTPDAAAALERWLHSWPGFGAVITGMQAQGFASRPKLRGTTPAACAEASSCAMLGVGVHHRCPRR
ncbi:MAG: hypothetical protein HYR51_07400 [Candidatus Rokubacteria bacterium]|nr:hypothetical protein [Candidatus Rokubacteria bacterium]